MNNSTQPKIDKMFPEQNRAAVINQLLTNVVETDEIETMDDFDDIHDELVVNRSLVFMPCAAHNMQLVINTGFKLMTYFDNVIKKAASIFRTSKQSHIVAEQLTLFNIKFKKANAMRWNSTLSMVRSILLLKAKDFVDIRAAMRNRTEQEKLAKKNFNSTNAGRMQLIELENILLPFEWVTNRLQSDEITISK
jgi:hypothetical protein